MADDNETEVDLPDQEQAAAPAAPAQNYFDRFDAPAAAAEPRPAGNFFDQFDHPATANGGNYFDQFDEKPSEAGKQPKEPEAEGTFGTIARKVVHNVLPTAAAIGTGVLTAPAGPWVAIPAGIGAFWGTSELQEKGLKALGYGDEHQRAANAQANPKADIAADVLSAAIPFGVGPKLALAQRALGGGIGVGLEGVGQLRQGEFDPTRLAVAGATGFTFNQPRAGTAAFERGVAALGARAIPHGSPGAEAAAGTAEAKPAPSEAGGAPQPVNTNNYAKAEPRAAPEEAAGGVNLGSDPTIEAAMRAKMQPEGGAEPAAPPSAPARTIAAEQQPGEVLRAEPAAAAPEPPAAYRGPEPAAPAPPKFSIAKDAETQAAPGAPPPVAVPTAGGAPPPPVPPPPGAAAPPGGGLPPRPPVPPVPPQPPPPPPGSVAAAQAAVLGRVATARPSLLSRIPSWREIYTALKNDIDPLEQTTKALAQGRQLPAEQDPNVLARLTRGLAGRVEQQLNHATFDVTTGRDTGASLAAVLKPVANDMDGLTAYAIAKHAIELEGRGVKTGVPLTEANTVAAAGAQRYEPVFRELVGYQDRQLDNLVKAGILSAGDAQKMRAVNKQFVPFYRLLDPKSETGQQLGAGAGLQVKDPIKRIKGSERQIIDPIDSIIKNTYLFTSLAERNLAGQALENLALAHPAGDTFLKRVRDVHPTVVSPDEINRFMQQHGIPASVSDAMTVFRANAFRPSADEIRVFRDGKSRVYEVADQALGNAVNAMDRNSLNLLTRILAAPARLLRAGATLSPEFIVRNPVRDQFSALAFSKYGYIPVYDMVRGMGHLFKKDDIFQSWLKFGGANGTLVALDRKAVGLNPKTLADRVGSVIKSPIEALRTASELMENATRLGEFARGIRQGASPTEAAFASREVTLDFARIGAKTKALNAIIPFFNAQVEGVDRAARAFRDNPGTFLTKVGASITLPSVLLWFANKNDERVQQLPQWQKDLFWIVPTDKWVPMTADERAKFPQDISTLQNTIRLGPNGQWQRNAGTMWKIPKPFELGVLFGSVPERALDAYFTHNPNAFKNLGKSIEQALTPGFIPQAALPFMEQWANKSFFLDRALLTAKQEKLPPAQQVGPFTSETAKMASSVIRNIAGEKSSFGSPVMIDNYIRQWTGGLGQYVVQGIDKALKSSKDLPPQPAASMADLPGIKAFAARFPSSSAQAIENFYDERKDRQTEQAGIKDQRKKDPEGAQKRMDNSSPFTGDPIAKALAADRNQVKAIMEDRKMSPDDKRAAIDLTYLLMIEHAKQGLRTFEFEQNRRKQPAMAQ